MVDMCYAAAPGHLMNMDTWNSLPEEYQQAIDDPELVSWVENTRNDLVKENNDAAIKNAPDNGVEVVEISEEEHQKFIDAANKAKEGMVEEWNKQGLPGTEILDKFVEICGTY